MIKFMEILLNWALNKFGGNKIHATWRKNV